MRTYFGLLRPLAALLLAPHLLRTVAQDADEPPTRPYSLPTTSLFLFTGNLLKVTEGEHAGKLCLLDFGLVAEVPPADREAMVSATIHLANRDWPALIDDFVALEFLPAGCDRGVIIPVMDRVLSPYLRGGGAKSFNFQVSGWSGLRLVAARAQSGRERWRWTRLKGVDGTGRGVVCFFFLRPRRAVVRMPGPPLPGGVPLCQDLALRACGERRAPEALPRTHKKTHFSHFFSHRPSPRTSCAPPSKSPSPCRPTCPCSPGPWPRWRASPCWATPTTRWSRR